MGAIYTVALNPAIDRTFWVDRIDFEESNRVHRECRYAGGKGIDISKVLTNLGTLNVALGFVGGFTGDELECRLTNEGVRTDFVRISGETRTNVIVTESTTGRQILLTAAGPEVTPYELGLLLKKVEGLEDPSIAAVAGSLPPGVHPEVYRRIISALRKRGAVTLLDADGDALRVGLEGGPDYIKPNVRELGQLVRRKLEAVEEVREAAREALDMGAGTVLASMGARGMLLVGRNESYRAVPPRVEAVNTVGVGDSAVAGFIYGLAAGMDLPQCLAYATAAGTSTALRTGTARSTKEDILQMVPRIKLESMAVITR
jgi:6-phosphofructokinase 2